MQFYDDMLVRAQDDGESSRPFSLTNGVKQGCIMIPTLFSMIVSAVLTDACYNNDIGIAFRYQFDWKLYNLHRP